MKLPSMQVSIMPKLKPTRLNWRSHGSNRPTIKVKVLSILNTRVDEKGAHEAGSETTATHEIAGISEEEANKPMGHNPWDCWDQWRGSSWAHGAQDSNSFVASSYCTLTDDSWQGTEIRNNTNCNSLSSKYEDAPIHQRWQSDLETPVNQLSAILKTLKLEHWALEHFCSVVQVCNEMVCCDWSLSGLLNSFVAVGSPVSWQTPWVAVAQ